MLDRILVEHCAPTLAGLKAANLFRYFFSSSEELREQIQTMNRLLNGKGLYFEILSEKNTSSLILTYRKEMLQNNLVKEGVADFLASYGYTDNSVAYCIDFLKKRISESGKFPHEIGIFIGYPLEDVVGFIANDGRNSKFTGCWKVYHNEGEAEKLFHKFQKCKDVYLKLFSTGRSITQLTVAV